MIHTNIAASSYTASSSSSSHSAGGIVIECRFNMLKTLVLYLGVSIIHRTLTLRLSDSDKSSDVDYKIFSVRMWSFCIMCK